MQVSKTMVIVELAQTHEGNVVVAKRLIGHAAKAGADAVKFHMFTADELAVPQYQHYVLLKKLQWPKKKWQVLVDYAHHCGIQIFADVLGAESLATALAVGIDAIKVHATDLNNEPFLKLLAPVNKPLFLSCGGSDEKELRAALKILRHDRTSKAPIVLLYGFQSYPTLIADTHLLKMKYLGEQLKMPYGYADHIDGDDPQRFALCAMAVGAGAVVLEKHLTIDRALKMEDYESALDPADMKVFVTMVREWDAAKGGDDDSLGEKEMQYRRAIRRQVVAVSAISKGTLITKKNVALKRAPSDKEPLCLKGVWGRKAAQEYLEHDVIA